MPDLLTTGSKHYRAKGGIQPIEFIESNSIPFHEANVIKYVFRWKDADGLADLEKAKWYIERLIELNSKKIEKRQFDLEPGGISTGIGSTGIDYKARQWSAGEAYVNHAGYVERETVTERNYPVVGRDGE